MKLKKILLSVFLLAGLTFSQLLKAQVIEDTISYQKETVYNNVLKIDIFSPIAGMLAIAYERSFNDLLSGQMELRWLEDGFILTPEMRVYLSKYAAPQGVFIAPWMRFGNGLTALKRDSNFGAGLCVGAQTVKKRVAISAFIGPALYFASGEKTMTVLRGGIVLGYAF